MMTATECPSAKQLRALSLGQLPDEQSDELFDHVRTCGICRAQLETVEDTGDSLVAALLAPDEERRFEAEPDCRLAVAKALGALAHTGKSASTADLANLPDKIGEYEIVRPLGHGGMGNVFLARHTKLDRQVALKVLASHRLTDPRMRRRFESEMLAVGRLSHPNIVTAHDAREIDGTAVLVTEYIDGLDLGDIVSRIGALSIADACEVARQTAVALEYVSRQGFVHRDVKPSNIMLSATGEVKLLDLGLARLQFGDRDAAEITGAGQAMGTADYVAPEQVSDSRNVDKRADIYALGCTLFKLLAGSAPFADERHATAFAKMTAHVSTEPPRLSDLRPDAPAGLVELVHTMLAKNPDQRPQTPQAVAEKLAPFAPGNNLQELASRAAALPPLPLAPTRSTTTPPAAAPLPLLRRPVPMGVAVGAGLVGLVLGLLMGIIITITNPDGSQTQVIPPEGAHVAITDDDRGAAQTKQGAAAAGLGGDVPQATLLDRLQGVWRAVEVSDSGRKMELGGEVILMAFGDGEYYLAQGDELAAAGKFSLKSGVGGSPDHKIDLVDQFNNGSTQLGIFQFLAEGKLQLCINERDTLERPSRFASEPNSANDVLLMLERLTAKITDSPYKSQRDLYDPEKQPLFRAFSQIQLANQAGPENVAKQAQANRAPAYLAKTRNNLKQIGIAFHNFTDTYGHFPGSANTLDGARSNGDKKVYPFSWRVAILPFINQAALYEQYRFNEPWDSEHNLTLLEKMPALYRSPFAPEDQQPGHTNYQGFAGERTALGAGGDGASMREILDGTSNTLLIVEAQRSIPWTKPEDLPFPGNNQGGLFFPGEKSLNYLMSDGRVTSLEAHELEKLNKLITRDGGEEVEP